MRRTALSSLFCLILLTGFGQKTMAQEEQVGQIFKNTAKNVVLDPTTYAPTVLSWFSKKLDWDSSQIFFRNGYVEANPDFTVNGLPYDKPISHSTGNVRIIKISLPVLSLSVLNNFAISMPERILIRRHPSHKKLIKSISWIDKIAMASYFSYKYSQPNFSQWQTNNRMAHKLGLK